MSNDFLDPETCKKHWPCRDPPKMGRSIAGAVAISFLIIIVLSAVNMRWLDPAIAVAIIGGIVFFGTLALADYVTPDEGVSTGELRTAISAAIIVVYLMVIALSLGDKFGTHDVQIIDVFSNVVIVVVAFYFGSKGAKELVALWKET